MMQAHEEGAARHRFRWLAGAPWPAAMLALASPLAAAAPHEDANAFLRATDDVSAVTQIVLRERQARDSAWWDRMRDCYWPQSRVDISWFHGDAAAFVEASRRQVARGDRGKHRLQPPIVEIEGTRAHVEMGSRNWTQATVDGKTVNLYADMRLNYRLEKRGGDWKIVALNPIYEHSELVPEVPGETLTVAPAEYGRYRPSYAALAWMLTRKGLTISPDEIGIDRPEGVEAYYAGVRKWLDEAAPARRRR